LGRFRILRLLAIVFFITFLFLWPAIPVHASNIAITPTSGATASIVHISGYGFSGHEATIYWDRQATLNNIPISERGELNYDYQVPTDAKGAHTIKITDDSNWDAGIATATFTILPAISIFPTIGRPYASIIVTGTGFGRLEKDIKITMDKSVLPTPISANYMGTWSANIDAPGPNKGEHFISAFSASTTAAEVGDHKFIAGPFASINPTSGPVGSEISIDGCGFRTSEDGITITWDNQIIFMNFIAGFDGILHTTFTVPATTQGHHLVGLFGSDFTPKGVIPDMYFNVVPNIELQPASGNKGTKVTVNGTGFAKGETINLSFEGNSLNIDASTDDHGSFTTNFLAPQSANTENKVKAQGTTGSSSEAIFVIQRVTPPAPTLVYPEPGSTVAAFNSTGAVFIGAAKQLFRVLSFSSNGRVPMGLSDETFQWSNDNNKGNKTYCLQIANNGDFSSPILSKEGLTSTEYTLSDGEVLSIGKHSWRVRAVDEIGNEGSWSEARQFTVISMSAGILIMSLTIPLLFIGVAIAVGIVIWRRHQAGT